MTKKIEPQIMTIVATGANHTLLYANAVAAKVALDNFKKAFYEAKANQLGNAFTATTIGAELAKAPVLPVLEMTDDFGSTLVVDLLEVKSFRVTDCEKEQVGGGELKIRELESALAFQEHVRANHQHLLQIRDNAGGPKIFVPPGRN